jgi:hypothetical protein
MYSLGAMKETTCSNAVGKSFELSYVWPRQHQFFEVGPLRFPGPHFVFDSSFSKYLCPWYTPRIPLHPNLCGSKATMVTCVDAPPPSWRVDFYTDKDKLNWRPHIQHTSQITWFLEHTAKYLPRSRPIIRVVVLPSHNIELQWRTCQERGLRIKADKGSLESHLTGGSGGEVKGGRTHGV